MSGNSKIEWTEVTWNPVTGCSKVSPGCENCYAEKLSHRFGWTAKPWTAVHAAENVKLHPDRLEIPLEWKKPRMIFVNSMSDLFHEQVPLEFIAMVFDAMAECKQHTFQVLTKRPERMKQVLEQLPNFVTEFASGFDSLVVQIELGNWPLTNVWLGVTAEDQRRAEERIPLLLQVPAAVRFLSCEPLLGPVDLSKYLPVKVGHDRYHWDGGDIDWVIVGGESGPGARPMHPDWARSIRDQCTSAGVPFFFKQWGEFAPHEPNPDYDPEFWVTESGSSGYVHTSFPTNYNGELTYMNRVGKKKGGRILDGREWNEMPEEST